MVRIAVLRQRWRVGGVIPTYGIFQKALSKDLGPRHFRRTIRLCRSRRLVDDRSCKSLSVEVERCTALYSHRHSGWQCIVAAEPESSLLYHDRSFEGVLRRKSKSGRAFFHKTAVMRRAGSENMVDRHVEVVGNDRATFLYEKRAYVLEPRGVRDRRRQDAAVEHDARRARPAQKCPDRSHTAIEFKSAAGTIFFTKTHPVVVVETARA